MKRNWIAILLLCLALTLSACTQHSSTYTAERNGKAFLVDTESCTITEGDNRYHYKFSIDQGRDSITITYPNGSSYWWSQSRDMGGWSPDYDETAYTDGDTLCQLVRLGLPKGGPDGKVLCALALMLLGLLHLAFPKAAWYISYGWRYKDAEPSDAALIFARIGGVAAMILGFLLLG